MSSTYIYEGTGKPKIIFIDDSASVLPEPVGASKDGLRMYDFETTQGDLYWSEKGVRNIVGKKFIFTANLLWVSMPKESLKVLWKAEKEIYLTFYLNEDETDIFYKCEVIDLEYKFFKGIPGHRAGYTVKLKLRGTEQLNTPGYASLPD